MAELTIAGVRERTGTMPRTLRLVRSRTTSTGAGISIHYPAEELTTGSFALDDEARPAAGKRKLIMRRLTVFNLMSLDGYIAGEGGDISWHMVDEEFQELANAASNSGNTLLFGRVTYELMAGFWPTPEAIKADPVVAAGMNSSEKIVFSRTLQKADWANTRLVKDDMPGAVRKLKAGSGKDLTVLGSGSIVAQLAREGLIDEYEVLLNPVVLGKGKTMFEGLQNRLALKLIDTRRFGNGNILLRYEPAKKED